MTSSRRCAAPVRRSAGWRRLGLAVACTVALGASSAGCSSSGTPGALATDDPARAFAPAVMLDSREPWRPMGAQWFIDRSALWFAEDYICRDRRIAVGRELERRRRGGPGRIVARALGSGPRYAIHALDEKCAREPRRRYEPSERTRPRERSDRPDDLGTGEGFYLDLVDSARSGPPSPTDVPAYFEVSRSSSDGDRRIAITYWMLYGMSEPADASDDAIEIPITDHEGDWERLEIIATEDGGSYAPEALRVYKSGRRRDIPWDRLRRMTGSHPGSATHPVVLAKRGTHELTPAPRSRSDCRGCTTWATWRRLQPAASQPWYGFGGAWGEQGPTPESTGALGPRPQSGNRH